MSLCSVHLNRKTNFGCNLIGIGRMVKPRIGSALKVVDAQIAASRESSTESWVSVEMAAVALRLRWRRSKPENPVVENHPDGRGGLATYPSLLVSWIRMFYQVLQKSNTQLGISVKFFLIFSHDVIKMCNFNEFKNNIASFCEENTCFPLVIFFSFAKALAAESAKLRQIYI